MVMRPVDSMVNACIRGGAGRTAYIGSGLCRSLRKAKGVNDSCITVHHVRNGRVRNHPRTHIAVAVIVRGVRQSLV
jgi:hypothetical protein